MNKTFIKVFLAILAVPFLLTLLNMVGVFGYLPSKAAVSREFERRHVGWRVADVTVGGGDEDGFYYSIRYRKPPDTELHKADWYVSCSGITFGWKIVGESLDTPSAM